MEHRYKIRQQTKLQRTNTDQTNPVGDPHICGHLTYVKVVPIQQWMDDTVFVLWVLGQLCIYTIGMIHSDPSLTLYTKNQVTC